MTRCKLNPALARTFILALLTSVPICVGAQTIPTLAPDSIELFATFFTFHDEYDRWVTDTKQAKPNSAAAYDDAASKELRIDRNDLGNLRGVTNSVMADLKNIQKDWERYVNGRTRYEQAPEPAVIQQFLQRRQDAIQAGIDKLQKNLSPSSWAGLRGYINTVHRQRFRKPTAAAK